MLLSYVRASVLGLLEERGPLTTHELVALDPQLIPGTLRSEFLRYQKRRWITREMVKVGRFPMYRYAITERGRAVLAGDRVDPDAVAPQPQWVRRELVLDGCSHTIEEAAALHGLKPKTVRQRLARGATPEEAVRPRADARRVEVDGERVTLLEAAQRAGVTYDSVRRRLAEGRPAEQVVGGAYFRPRTSRAAIKELLAGSPEMMTRREIADALGAHQDTTRGNLDRMLAAGELRRERAALKGEPWLYGLAVT